jgi:hypothetical protein
LNITVVVSFAVNKKVAGSIPASTVSYLFKYCDILK